MATDGAVPPVNFDKRFEKPPQQQQKQKNRQQHQQDDSPEHEVNHKPRPVDPENPPNIDLTA